MKKTRFNALKSLLIVAAICAGFAASTAGNLTQGNDANITVASGAWPGCAEGGF